MNLFLFAMLCSGVPEPACRSVDDRGPLSHLSSAAPLLCHWAGWGRLVRNSGQPVKVFSVQAEMSALILDCDGFASVLSCSGVLWCVCLSPRTWTVCSWKHTLIPVNDDTWSSSVSRCPENWVIWLPYTLRSVYFYTVPSPVRCIMSGITLGGGNTVCVCFQKAIMECDEEWAMNKKVVDLSSKHIRQAVSPLCHQWKISVPFFLPHLFPLSPPFIHGRWLFVAGSSRSALLCCRLRTSGRVCSCHWKWTEVPPLLWQGQ